MAKPNSYKDPYWSNLSKKTEKKLELPEGLLSSIVVYGERSNADQVSEAGAKTPFQITPPTRKLIIDKYGIDPYLNDENAAEAAGLLLKEGLKRNGGDVNQAVGEYHGGTNRKNWGPRTVAYQARVSDGLEAAKIESISAEFGDWLSNKDKQAETQTEQPTEQSPVDEATLQFGDWLKNKPKEQPQSEEPSLWAQTKDLVTGELRQTPESQSLPEWVTMPELNDIASVAGWKTAIGTLMSSPEETVQIIKANSPNSQVRQDEKGNFIIKSGTDGKDYVIPPGLSTGDIPRILAGIAAFTPAGRMTTAGVEGIAGGVLGSGLTQGAVEASQAATGGEFNPEAVSAAALIGGAIPAAIQAVPTVMRGVKAAAQPAKQVLNKIVGNAPQQAAQPVTAQGVGAEALGLAERRIADAQSLDVPIDLTRAEATRLPKHQQQEDALARGPFGEKLHEAADIKNQKLYQNLDLIVDGTNATAASVEEAGVKLDSVLRKKIETARLRIGALYKKADNSPEAQLPVSLDKTIETLNSREKWMPESGDPLEITKKRLLELGAIKEKQVVENGVEKTILVKGKDLTQKDIENGVYKFINQNSPSIERIDKAKLRDIKSAINQDLSALDQKSPLYANARAANRKFIEDFERHKVITDLTQNKLGTDDRKTAIEHIFNKTVLAENRSIDDLSHLKKILLGGKRTKEGREAWNELRGQFAKHIREEAFDKNNSTNSLSEQVISPSKLNQAIKKYTRNGKLDFMLGTADAEKLRTIGDVANYIFTNPPKTVNGSGTAGQLTTIMLDMAASGSVTGLPLPLVHTLKYVKTHINNRKVQKEIEEILNYSKRKTGKF